MKDLSRRAGVQMARTHIGEDFFDDRLLSGKLTSRQLRRRLVRRQRKQERPWR
jgi:hypothetical protein